MPQAAKKRVKMTEGPLLGVLLRVAWPITAAGLAQAMHQIVNGWFVGRLGADAIAAVSASGALVYILISLGSGLSTAGAVLVAQNAGAGRTNACNHVAAQTLLMVLAVGVGFTILGLLFARPVLRLIGVEAEVFELSWQYLVVSYLGLVPMFAVLALQAMLQSSGEVRFPMQVMVAAVLLNIALDPVLIFGTRPLGGDWHGLGVGGAALATAIAQAAAFVVLLRHMMGGRSALHLKRQEFRPDWPHFQRALGIGLPASLE
jgi:putative MATE family efflux protein